MLSDLPRWTLTHQQAEITSRQTDRQTDTHTHTAG